MDPLRTSRHCKKAQASRVHLHAQPKTGMRALDRRGRDPQPEPLRQSLAVEILNARRVHSIFDLRIQKATSRDSNQVLIT
jgi:hypothetical protein